MSEIPVESSVLAESVWISFSLATLDAQIGFQPHGRPLNYTKRTIGKHDLREEYSIFVADEGYSETDTHNGVIGEVVYAPDTLRTAVVKIVGDGPPRYHVVEIRGGWTAWIRP